MDMMCTCVYTHMYICRPLKMWVSICRVYVYMLSSLFMCVSMFVCVCIKCVQWCVCMNMYMYVNVHMCYVWHV